MIESIYPDSFHNPLFCSEGAGQTKIREERLALQAKGGGRKVPGWLFLLQGERGNALVLLSWYNCDGEDISDLLTLRLQTIFRPFFKRIPPSYMVRISTQIPGYNHLRDSQVRRQAEEDATKLLIGFCQEFIPVLDKAVAEARQSGRSAKGP